jgi:hypothetical protein
MSRICSSRTRSRRGYETIRICSRFDRIGCLMSRTG